MLDSVSDQPSLNRADCLAVRAAVGWLELGCPEEAAAELAQVSPAGQRSVAVMEMHWQVFAAMKDWEQALTSGRALVQAAPDEPAGWLHVSYSLHELKRTAEARDNLEKVVQRFPDQTTMTYNLACYECQLGQLGKAQHWLELAFQSGDPAELKAQALADPDLVPMRDTIRQCW